MSRTTIPGFVSFRGKRKGATFQQKLLATFKKNYKSRAGQAIHNPLTLHVPDTVDDESNCMKYDVPSGILRVLTSDISGLQAVLHAPALIYQTFDGGQNNLLMPTWGQANLALLRKAASDYKDGSSTLAERGASNPNPRFVSNAVCATNSVEPSTLNFSNMVWVWGQFVDHAVDLTGGGGSMANVLTGTSSPQTDPNEAYPDHTILFERSKVVSGSDPREQPNEISSFLDGTHVYGSNTARATALRRLDGSGKLKTSTGDLLPYNVDALPNAMPPGATASDFFLAGDVRANENACLTAMHTLFVREHNRQCDALLTKYPSWAGDDEKLYQQARHRVNALIQHITYDYFLPALLGTNALPAYSGYKPYVNPTVATEFSTVGYRLGHAMIPSLLQVGPNGGDTALLRTLFFNPAYVAANGIEGLLQGASRLVMKEINTRIVDDLRNFLFGPPAANMLLDLVTLNLQRARDHGIPDYNAVRSAYGLSTVSTYAEVTSDTALQTALSGLYDAPGNLDPWVGCLAEDHVSGAGVGALVKAILVDQFTRLRDGDRFWYEANVVLSEEERDTIRNTTLADIIRRNTGLGTTDIAVDVFHVA